ncbi:McrB family protein [Lutimonas vermicola]|uniref:AAA family ATPase n=1 Tax=Lutimonas vermicola TaxID=414288 RepID=A0ABU9KYD2_9FLAO
MEKKEFKKTLTPTDIGKTKSHLGGGFTTPSKEVDSKVFFTDGYPKVYNFYDKNLKKTFDFYVKQNGHKKNNEVRLSRMANYFKLKKAEVNDFVHVERDDSVSDHQPKYYIDVIKANNEINLKEDFADWFIKKNGSQHNYFKNSFRSDRDKLIEALTEYEGKYFEEFKKYVFKLNSNEIPQLIKQLSSNLKIKNGSFFTFSLSKSRRMPSAILGSKNYIKFLKELLSKTNVTNIQTSEDQNPELFAHPKNQILFGPPGTGKTYNMVNFSLGIVNEKETEYYSTDIKKEREVFENKFRELMEQEIGGGQTKNQIYFVTFHQSYSYEDFVLGIAPDLSNEKLKFKRKKGIFYIACENALNNPDDNFVMVIDEINRANISRVFGELITLIEDDKRISKVQDRGMRLMLPNAPSPEDDPTNEWEFSRNFGVPENLYIVGTMNTADKSIAALDIALRRRFRFIAKYPDLSLVKDDKLNDIMSAINSEIIKPDGDFERGADFTLGHSYFMNKSFAEVKEIMDYSIIPLLLEYYMNDFIKVQELLNKCLKSQKLEVTKDEFDGTLSITPNNSQN